MKISPLIVAVLGATLTIAGVVLPPTKSYLRAMEAALEAESELLVCRAANTTERLRDAGCFQQACRTMPYNATWWKQLGALQLMSGLVHGAAASFNSSYTTILDANGFLADGMAGLSPKAQLAMYFSREREGGIELAKVWFEALALQHRVAAARDIAAEFLLEVAPAEGEQVMRTLGDAVELTLFQKRRADTKRRRKRSAKSAAVFLAEAVVAMVEARPRHWLSGALTATPAGRTETTDDDIRRCRHSLGYRDEYRSADVVRYLEACVASWDGLQAAMASEDPAATKWEYMALGRTPLHTFAGAGASKIAKIVAGVVPQAVRARDKMGRAPLHYAVAHGQLATTAALLELGARVDDKDAGGTSVADIACSGSFRSQFETVAPPGACAAATTQARIADDADDEVDVTGGGWAVGAATTDTAASCPLHLRAASGMSHFDLVGRYLLQAPVVLRDVARPMQRHFTKTRLGRAQSLARRELYPTSEYFGTAHEGNQSIASFIVAAPPERFAMAELTAQHPLRKQVPALKAPLVPAEGFTTAADTHPHLLVATPGARTNHATRDEHLVQHLLHGTWEVLLAAPAEARTTRSLARFNVSDATLQRCVIHGGDSLVVPAAWSFAVRSVGESVAVWQAFRWR